MTMDWQPIDTAPTDGTVVIVQGDQLLAMAAQYRHGMWWRDNGYACFTVYCKPERWIPMPAKDAFNVLDEWRPS